jgi:hypothetical protein
VSRKWAGLSPQPEPAGYFQVSTRIIDEVMRLLVERWQAIKSRQYRQPDHPAHELRSIDPRRTAPRPGWWWI